jgi:hypothetical protein
MAGCCGHYVEYSGYIKRREIIDHLRMMRISEIDKEADSKGF